MPDSTQPKIPTTEPPTETSDKESIRKAQEEFVGDEATPSRDKSEYDQDQGSQSSDRGVEDGQLSGPDRGSQSSDRAVEDASLLNMAVEEAEADEEDDDLEDEDGMEEDSDEDDEDGEDPDETDADDETEATPSARRALVGA